MPDTVEPFRRHLRACRNAVLPGARLPFFLAGQAVGWLDPALEGAVLARGGRRLGAAIHWDDAATLPDLAQALAAERLVRWRGEAFDVRASADGPALGRIDRGALPAFGIMAQGVHVNGLVRRPDGLHLWVGRRGADRPLDPGKLDNLVAGGVGAGYSLRETLVKEAGEEAAIPPDLAAGAVAVGRINYAVEREEGLRRDTLHCFDLALPADFVPRPEDGEAVGFELWPIERVRDRVRDTDDFKFNVALVLIDLLLRHGVIESPALAAELRQG